MQHSHPVYGDLVTSNRLIRSGRPVFRGTVVLLDDVLGDLRLGLSLQAVWEKYDALERKDLEAVVAVRCAEDAPKGGQRRMADA